MESSVKQRIIQFIDHKDIPIREFERICSLSNGYVKGIKHSILPGKMKNISLHFPDLSTNWLMTGEGEMLKGDVKSSCATEATTPIEVLKFISLLERKDEQIDRLITLLERQTQPCTGYGFKKPTPILCEEITKYAKK